MAAFGIIVASRAAWRLPALITAKPLRLPPNRVPSNWDSTRTTSVALSSLGSHAIAEPVSQKSKALTEAMYVFIRRKRFRPSTP
jgi:hypothetical protein